MARHDTSPRDFELPGGYGSRARHDALAHLQPPLGKVLDVGCGGGAHADALRAMGASELYGFDVEPAFVASAAENYDHAVCASAEEEIPFPTERFSTILCYDVLEHLHNPWATVAALVERLEPGGYMHVSLPNVRHRSVVIPLVLQGRLEYQPSGILDITHLRFFTRREAIRMLSDAGLRVKSVRHTVPQSSRSRVFHRLTNGRWAEFASPQWYLLGERS